MAHLHSEEYLVFERLHERERQIEQQHKLAYQRERHLNSMQRLIGSIGTFFVALGTRMQKVQQHGEHAV
jgi:hypothetical protein